MEAYATASRLSYALWDTMPDDALLDRAADGRARTRRKESNGRARGCWMIRAPGALDEFTSQWLRFDRALAAARERRTFPMFSRELVLSMIEEASRFVGDLVWNDRNFMDLFRADYGFVNSDLATVYGVPAPARISTACSSRRSGARRRLGQALFLALTSKPEEPRPPRAASSCANSSSASRCPAAAGRRHESAAGRRGKPQTNRERLAGTCDQPGLRELPQR